MLNRAIGVSRQGGVSMVETMLVLPVMLFIGMGIVHLGLVYQAKSNLEYAALMAARVGAVTNIDVPQMISQAVQRMKPSQIGDVAPVADDFRIVILNPTTAVFNSACAVVPTDGTACDAGINTCAIPSFGLQYRSTNPVCAGESIQDANILRIKLIYNFDSHVPFMNAHFFTSDTGKLATGISISAVATVRMQSDAHYVSTNSAAFSP